MTLLEIERAVRRAVTAILEHELPIALAVRAAATALLQGDPDPAAALPHERPSERCARQNREGLIEMAELEASGRGRDAAVVVAKRQVADPRDPDSVYRRAQLSLRTGAERCSRPGLWPTCVSVSAAKNRAVWKRASCTRAI
jgi:hypothetical protein